MTLHTKAATEDVFEMFNQPLRNLDMLAAPTESDVETDCDDDYTSADESTGTGRISAASEFGNTQPDLITGEVNPSIDTASVSPWSDFTTSKHVPSRQHQGHTDVGNVTSPPESESTGVSRDSDDTQLSAAIRETENHLSVLEDVDIVPFLDQRGETLKTPTLPEENDEGTSPRTRYIPLPPKDYEPPLRTPRDPELLAQNRLPYMTPIAEKTESSLGAFTAMSGKDYFNSKTPSRENGLCENPEIQEAALSSPLQEIVNEAKPSRSQRRDQPVQHVSKLEPAPVIKDAQCNPTDEAIRDLILESELASIKNTSGFYDHRPLSCGRAPEIRKYIKSLSKSKQDAKATTSVYMPPVLRFEKGGKKSYSVKRELGKGAFAPVYLVEEENVGVEAKELALGRTHPALVAMKCEHPPTPWEFYIMSTLQTRLSSLNQSSHLHPSVIPSFCKPTAFHLFADEAYLLETFLDQGTILDLVNIARSDTSTFGQSGTLDESTVMFFTLELLRSVEAMHAAGILHGDLKADNCLVRLKTPSQPSPSSSSSPTADQDPTDDQMQDRSTSFSPTGAHGWSQYGFTLIDFGRSIDLRAFQSDVQFIADWKTTKQDCPEMRSLRPWTYQVDYWGLAGIVHNLLWGKYLDDAVVPVPHSSPGVSEASADERAADCLSSLPDGIGVVDNRIPGPAPAPAPAAGPGMGKSQRIKPREPLKRYWQTAIWSRLFDILLNPALVAAAPVSEGGERSGKMPCVNALAEVKAQMEKWLAGEGGRRNGGLKAALRRLEERIEREKGRGR